MINKIGDIKIEIYHMINMNDMIELLMMIPFVRYWHCRKIPRHINCSIYRYVPLFVSYDVQLVTLSWSFGGIVQSFQSRIEISLDLLRNFSEYYFNRYCT